jgi:hypothetical protein
MNQYGIRDRRGLKQIRIFSLRIMLGVLQVRCKITDDRWPE